MIPLIVYLSVKGRILLSVDISKSDKYIQDSAPRVPEKVT